MRQPASQTTPQLLAVSPMEAGENAGCPGNQQRWLAVAEVLEGRGVVSRVAADEQPTRYRTDNGTFQGLDGRCFWQ